MCAFFASFPPRVQEREKAQAFYKSVASLNQTRLCCLVFGTRPQSHSKSGRQRPRE